MGEDLELAPSSASGSGSGSGFLFRLPPPGDDRSSNFVLGLAAGVPWPHLVGRDELRGSVFHYPHRTVAVRYRVPAVTGRALCRLGRAVRCGVSRLGAAAAGQMGPALCLQVPVSVAPRAPLGLGDHRADLVGEVPGCDAVWGGGRRVKCKD